MDLLTLFSRERKITHPPLEICFKRTNRKHTIIEPKATVATAWIFWGLEEDGSGEWERMKEGKGG